MDVYPCACFLSNIFVHVDYQSHIHWFYYIYGGISFFMLSYLNPSGIFFSPFKPVKTSSMSEAGRVSIIDRSL